MFTFEATIWEKAEHWTFEITVQAKDETEARKRIKAEYPASKYSVRRIQRIWNNNPQGI